MTDKKTDTQSEAADAQEPTSGKKWEYVDMPEEDTVDPTEDHMLDKGDAGEYEGLSSAELIKLIEVAKEEAAANFERFARAEARVKNIQHTSRQEVDKARKFALQGFVQKLVDVVDNLERSMQAMPDLKTAEAGTKSMFEGIELTYKSLLDALEKHGVETVNPDGELFNPDLHEAISMQPSPGVEPNTVLQVLQKGYSLNQRLIRPAMVIVAKN